MPHVLLIRPLCAGDEPEFAEPEFDKPEPVSPAAEEPSYPSGISRFPKDETVIPKEE